jgi:hypothetical protein
MSTNAERSPFPTPTGRAEPMTDLDKPVGGLGPAGSMTVRREQAVKRIRAQKIHTFYLNLLIYLLVNATLVVLTASGLEHLVPPGFFWPIVSIVVWGVALAILGYHAYRGNVSTEEQIQREMQKQS